MSEHRPRLHLRLMLAAMAAIMGALLIAWMVMVMLFDRHIERRVQEEMRTMAVPLLADLGIDDTGMPSVENPPFDPRFELPGSGMYWQVSAGTQKLRSRSLWDESLTTIGSVQAPGWVDGRVDGPFGQRVLQSERWVSLDDASPAILVQLAQSEKRLLAARHQFAREMALFLCLLWLVLVMAAWLQVHFGLKPLSTVRDELSRLQQSPAARISNRHPIEISSLIRAINELAEMRERDLVRARRRAADLAHSLKTPLSAFRSVSRDVRDAGALSQADALDELILATSSAVDAELTSIRIGSIHRSGTSSECAPLDIAERVVSVVSRSLAGSEVVFDVDIDDTQRLPVANEDLLEILGALIENAARYAQRRVRISMHSSRESEILAVEDDGKGLDMTSEQALARGVRLDESGSSHQGLGLSIVRDLVEATGGEISLNHASLGGLRVTMVWRPRSQERGR